YIELLPQSKVVWVSASLEDEAERASLKALVTELSAQHGVYGYIVRTNAEGQQAEAIAEDIAYLTRVWNVVERRGREAAS
ncbi:ribonuclease E/G, partial [Stenotrophomonas maltophilia]|uniref:ribonuclease E/G n=1 Tax=Stenotrophomonas maltophilia TaxID=40324 RepID=UPI00313B4D3C